MPIIYRITTLPNTGSSFIKNEQLSFEEMDGNMVHLLNNMSGSSNYITGSTGLLGDLQVKGSVSVTGTLSAQTLVVEMMSSSVVYSSGSNIFGNNLSNTQSLTGSVSVTGSLDVNGSNVILTNQTSSMTVLSSSYSISSSYAKNASSSSYALTASYWSGSIATASYALTASVSISSSYSNTSSYALTASYSTNAAVFPYTGSAIITGSLVVSSSTAFNTVNATPVTPFISLVSKTGQNGLSVWDNGSVLIGVNAISNLAGTATYGLYIDPGYTAGLYAGQVDTMRVIATGAYGGRIRLNPGNIPAYMDFQYSNYGANIFLDQGNGYLTLQGGRYADQYYGLYFGNLVTGLGMTMFGPTLNVSIGNSIFDSGYKLDVSGSMRVQGNTTITGSLTVTNGITGSIASSSYSITSSYAVTASYWSGSIVSSSYANTSSYALTASYWSGSIASASYASTASYVSGSITSASVADNYITNAHDSYTGTAKITDIITLTQAEYNGISVPSSNILYVII
jgi:hypothetical protein